MQETPDWAPPKKETRRLSDLCELWFRHHGSGLRAGADTHRRLMAMCEAMGDPRAEAFGADVFAEYRTRRLEAGITANNMNREHAYLRAVFNELIRLEHWKKENPLKKLRAFRIQERELSFLTNEQIVTLLQAVDQATNVHVGLIARICLETGARWGEAEALRVTQVRGGMIQFTQTKSSKNRAVQLRYSLVKRLGLHHQEHGNNERYFDSTANRWAFREAIKGAELQLPVGQLTHVLRHTFASHFMMNGGNILALQKLLGHQSLTMTMRYAHLSPDHLAEAKALNPLAVLEENPR